MRAKQIIAPFTLRRLKDEVLNQLMPKVHKRETVPLDPTQQAIYNEAVMSVRREAAGLRVTGSTAAQGVAALSAALGTNRLKALFTHLRKVANHPLLVRQRYDSQVVGEITKVTHQMHLFGAEASEKRVREHVEGLSDFQLHALCGDPLLHGRLAHLRLPASSALEAGKARRLVELVKELRGRGSRPLIFSQWKIMLDVLEWVLHAEGVRYARLDGDTPVSDRQRLVDSFNNEGSVLEAFLLSTRAGGQGLNLTGADTVILHDCDFNPQIDKQAEDRCHRLGQTRTVTVYRLVARGTVDERIMTIAQRKLSLDASVLGTGADDGGQAGPAEENRTMAEILAELITNAAE